MYWGSRPNGGTVVQFRTLQISLTLYLLALWLRTLFNAAWPWYFAPGQLWRDGATTIPWLGGIYLAVYAALYARFSNQMDYLSNTYNLLMQTQASIQNPNDNEKIQSWKVGLVEDADDLHLATKKMFSVFCLQILQDPTLGPQFDADTVNGTERRKQLQAKLKMAMGPNLPARVASPKSPAAAPAPGPGGTAG
jgi:hypothetical protein